jgi:hypothetical protein
MLVAAELARSLTEIVVLSSCQILAGAEAGGTAVSAVAAATAEIADKTGLSGRG